MPQLRLGRWALLAALFVCTAQAQVPEERLRACAACHGADGNSAIAGTPSIAGQPKIFLENYLVLTREGLRGNDVMQGLLKRVPDKEIVALAVHYTKLKSRSPEDKTDPKLFNRGKEIAARNRCASCHEKNFQGREQMPRLAGQREEFLAEVMLQYRQNRRPGGDTLMNAALHGIPEADFKALAHYFSRLK
ncbi:MAG: c-type cytochrome [Burkholderiales bacterium]